ncbi:penicillin acylase family protein [Photobacterium phosphoreum]|uniref:penicillin acylase family protein n=1 Tax=Photobacterium phosphoreum TaxID=659 RepID=UPI0039B0F9C5
MPRAEGEEPVDICKEVIEVRGEKSVKIDVLETPRGPIIVEGRDARLPISIQLPARKYSVSGFEALRSLLHAESVDDVEQAFSYWVEPVNVLQISDVNGKFVSKVVGQVPDRSTENFKRIVPAWSPDSVWIGRIEGKRSDNSEQAAVMANQRGLASDMGTEFSPEHRANRILSLVNFRDLWSVGEVQQIHTDTYLSTAPIILDIVASLSDLSQAAFRLQQILIRWDCNMEANSVEAALFSKLRANVVQQVSKVPDFQVMNSIIEQSEYSELFYPWLSLTSRIAFALNTLLTNEDLGLDVTSIVRKSLIDLSAEQHLDET